MLPSNFAPTHRSIRLGLLALVALIGTLLNSGGLALGGGPSPQAAPAVPPATGLAEPPGADPAEPLAAVDGVPITRGELNLLLGQRIGVDSLRHADRRLVQASMLMLVRRQLAMTTLAAMGGQALAARIEQALQRADAAAQRQGTSLQAQAERYGADVAALRRELAWQTAWQEYLRSRLTEENLQRFFDSNRPKYDGTRMRVSQIFLPEPTGSDEAEGRHAATLQRLAERIRASSDVTESFALAARDHSQGGSAEQGGQLGWITASGDLPAAVADAALRAEPGEVVGPVRSPLGVHLLLVHQRQPGGKELHEIEDQAPLRRDAADALFRVLVRRQAAANVQWLDATTEPPAEIPVLP